METVICKLNSWIMPMYFTEISHANQTKFTTLLFHYKRVDRLKVEISL